MAAEKIYQIGDAVIWGKFTVEGILTNGLLCTANDSDAEFPQLVLVPFTHSGLEEEQKADEEERRMLLDNHWGV